jgi:MFS family permease
MLKVDLHVIFQLRRTRRVVYDLLCLNPAGCQEGTCIGAVRIELMGLFAQGFSARFWALILATFLGFLGIGAVLPGMGPHLRRDLGGSDLTVGFVIGIFSFVALASRFISGPLADTRGRKLTFQLGLFSCSLAGTAYLLPIGLTSAYLGRIFQGFGEACLYTGAAAWVVEEGGILRSAQALGYLSSGIWGGISAGPVLGHWLGSFERSAMLQTVSAGLALAIITRVPEDYRPVTKDTARRTWIPRYLVAPGVTAGLVNVHYPVITGFLILYLAPQGNSGAPAFTAYAGLILFSRFFLGRLPDRIRPDFTFYGGLVLMLLGLGTLAAAPGPIVAVVAAAMLGFGFSFPWSSIAATVMRETPAHNRGSAIGVISAFYDLFVGISSFAAGAVAKQFGYQAAFAMGVLALLGAALTARLVFYRAIPEPAAEKDELFAI